MSAYISVVGYIRELELCECVRALPRVVNYL